MHYGIFDTYVDTVTHLEWCHCVSVVLIAFVRGNRLCFHSLPNDSSGRQYKFSTSRYSHGISPYDYAICHCD